MALPITPSRLCRFSGVALFFALVCWILYQLFLQSGFMVLGYGAAAVLVIAFPVEVVRNIKQLGKARQVIGSRNGQSWWQRQAPLWDG